MSLKSSIVAELTVFLLEQLSNVYFSWKLIFDFIILKWFEKIFFKKNLVYYIALCTILNWEISI